MNEINYIVKELPSRKIYREELYELIRFEENKKLYIKNFEEMLEKLYSEGLEFYSFSFFWIWIKMLILEKIYNTHQFAIL